MARRFENRMVLVTGAAAGLGRALAVGFAREGARLVLLDIDEAGLEQTVAEAAIHGATCSTHRVDVSVESEIHDFAREFCAGHERLDVLINNAGLAYGEIAFCFAQLSQEKWLRFFAVNAIAPVLLAQGLRAPLANAKGVILNQTSIASYNPGTAYGVTKAALNSMTFAMANAFAADGIRVNAVAPGIMETPANVNGLSPETYARVQGMQLLPLHGTADDIASLHLFLASDDARFINCEIIICDAGNRLRGWRG
jgi:3-oxoacyl-[acyl-carrier protein] reductase